MSTRQEPGDKAAIRAAIDARLQAEKEKLDNDPGAQKALASLRDAQAKEKVYPAPQTAIDDAQELLARIESKPTRKDTLREPIQKALQPEHPVGLRPITRKLSVADRAEEVVEPVRRLTAAGSREETLVGGRSVRTEEAEGLEDTVLVRGPTRWLWLVLFALAACIVAVVVWKVTSSAPGADPSSTSTAQPTASFAPTTTPSSAGSTSAPAPSVALSAPTPSTTNAVPTSSPPLTSTAPMPPPSVKPTTSATSSTPSPGVSTAPIPSTSTSSAKPWLH